MPSSAVVRSALGIVLGAITLAAASKAGRRAPPAFTPTPVVLRVSVDAGIYRRMLGDSTCTAQCLTLQQAVRDSLRERLRTAFHFIDWSTEGEARDTIDVRWVERDVANPPPLVPDVQMRLGVRGPEQEKKDADYPLLFETFDKISDRPPTGWRPESLQREWVARVDTIFRTNAEVFASVFGRIAIASEPPPVTPHDLLSADVKVPASDLGASETSQLEFQLEAEVSDSVRGTRAPARMKLLNCQTRRAAPGFNCQIKELRYLNQTQGVTGAELHDLLKHVTYQGRRLVVMKLQSSADSLMTPSNRQD